MSAQPPRTQLSMWGVVVIGVGSMVGAGLFALMGEAAEEAGPAVWLSFLMAGVVVLLTGHSYAQLGIRFPSRGGVVEYLVRGYGPGTFSGACSILYYISQLIGMAMVSLAFGKFAALLIGIEQTPLVWERALGSALILGLSALFLNGSQLISKMQKVLVVINLTILTGFTLALSTRADVTRLAVSEWPEATPILGSLALTVFAFTGFGVMCNSVEIMKNPKRDLPRAMYTSIGLVIVLYVALSAAVAGAVDSKELSSSGASLIAVAARSMFGELGFSALLVSAAVSSVTCLSGGLFGATNITFTLAERGQLPSRFERKIKASTHGLTITALLALLLINFSTLTTVASLGSATALMVFTLVNVSAFRLVKDSDKRRLLIALSIIACLFTLLVWMIYTYRSAPGAFVTFLVFLIAAIAAEALLQRFNGRRILAATKDSDPGAR